MNSQPENYEPMLKESIKHFLASYRNGNSDFSAFESIFFRLIQTMLDPPLEITWFYSAVTFHSSKSSLDIPSSSKMLVLAKDLFQLLISCSSLSNGFKRIALLAPVVFGLYDIVRDSSRNGLCLRGELEELVEKMVSYVSICCCGGDGGFGKGNESDVSVACFEDLVRVWTVDRVVEGCGYEENLNVFFPGLSDEVQKGIDGTCGIDYLAGIVLCEVFWLRLWLKFSVGVLQEELEMEMRNWAVQTIKGFGNSYFLDMLLRMLLEPTLPITNLLSSEDAVSLAKILYDTVLLVDYSCLGSGRWIQLVDNQSRSLALMWSLVADNAMQFARDICDHSRALSYANSFSKSQFSTQLIKWVSNQAGIDDKFRPEISTSRDLIRWLLVLEDQGLGVFDHNTSRFLTKAVASKLRKDSEFPEFGTITALNAQKNILGYSGMIERRECRVSLDEEMADPSCRAEPAATITNETSIEGRRKRKEGMMTVGEPRVKLVKYNLHENSIYNDKFGSGLEIINPVCDEDMEVMVTG
ncbi:hypothetical protein ACH5RR_041332 [Cinchona calisaya]|uniref:Uncharacterized protein n=1 Tax=Cinchona calisaya TaxID=153742 RepID=A0ABD2XX90_9GENT